MTDQPQPPSASSTPPPSKFSRYRSVRHTLPQPEHPPKEQKDNGDMQRTKSMSRYRRSKVAFQIDEKDQRPPVPALPNQQPVLYTKNPSGGRTTTRRVTEPLKGQMPRSSPRSSPHHSPRNSNSQAELQLLMQATRQSQTRRLETENERLRRKIREFQEREAAREVAQQKAQQEKEERERAYQLQKANAERALQKKRSQTNQAEQIIQKQKHEAEQARLADVEAARILEEQKRKDLERLQKELDAAAAASPPLPFKSPMREKFAFFSRKAGSIKDTPPPTATTVASVAPSPAPSIAPKVKEAPKQVQQPLQSRAPQRINEAPKPIERPAPSQAPKKVVELPQQIQQGGGGIVPQTDAPISASNAGERRVLVRCKQSSVNLPVNPETTPKEIIYSAANFMTQNIIPSTAILIESYTQLGLERRVRRYEHVRDVMNSWDRDTQNAFHLENSDTPRFDTDLELAGVPKQVPSDVTVYMYHSQKPDTWIKRHITLLSSGQVFIHKKPDAKLGDKNTIAICHLSDFDIYTPTPQQLRKTLKAPKKHCYAIKSQQKTAVFLSTENFVHFFSTDDELLAEKWYKAVQQWRSWYLVNRMGSGKKPKKPIAEIKATNAGSPLLSEIPDETLYMIGSFSGLGLDDFRSGSEEDFDTEDEERPRHVPFHLRNSVLISNAEAKREAKRHPPIVSYRIPQREEEEFTSSGLLGGSYTTRQQNSSKPAPAATGPFTDGPNLLNRDTARTLSITNSNSANGSRNKPKPLLDFTPTFKEAPQWDKTGKGHGVAPIAGVPLVEVATTPENAAADAMGMKGTVFRRETTKRPGSSGGPANGQSVMSRGRVRYDS
ncbi:uncharacterized protein LY89DRAFT_733562 [Mollisia scopiformis]|uniref:PH domain-containing protein n=1 Tax=Mollisia scopiformis TaxID=149040 RepID=A0A194XC42_MOLSC|nr:uncharacterized protein LY89DRAFT_733562 [Mollisia scopiformis]KUJ17735.1 hypothetical protein LY89DRAFT_733562 [Mollisia scopiformis]